MAGHPDVFNESVINLIKAGEQTGSLDLTLRTIPEFILYDRLKEWK